MQKTLNSKACFAGLGLHSGKMINVTVMPAPIGHGLMFRRTDVEGAPNIPARFDHVNNTQLNTQLSGRNGVTISTVEHLMAAMAGMGITNAMIHVDGPEIPIMDGSSMPFARAFWHVGILEQNAPATRIKVMKPIRVQGENGAFAELLPSPDFVLDISIDFPEPVIGQQSQTLKLENGVFLRELADCRTFCRASEVEGLHAQGLGLGGSLENALVIEGDRVLNPEGFRRDDECVRHKMLDAIGDLALAGGIIQGMYRGYMSGHQLTNQLLRHAFVEGAIQAIHAEKQSFHKLLGADIQSHDFVAVSSSAGQAFEILI